MSIDALSLKRINNMEIDENEKQSILIVVEAKEISSEEEELPY